MIPWFCSCVQLVITACYFVSFIISLNRFFQVVCWMIASQLRSIVSICSLAVKTSYGLNASRNSLAVVKKNLYDVCWSKSASLSNNNICCFPFILVRQYTEGVPSVMASCSNLHTRLDTFFNTFLLKNNCMFDKLPFFKDNHFWSWTL